MTAFTLSELMVVLVISSMVVTIAFFALNAVQKQIHTIRKVYENQQKIQYMERVLVADLNTHQGIYSKKDSILLFRNSKDSIQYHFKNRTVIRNKDTMYSNFVSKKIYFLGDEVKDGVVDALELHVSNTFSVNTIFVYKINDASQYVH